MTLPKSKTKTCKNCGKVFEVHRTTQIVCSSNCAYEWTCKMKEKQAKRELKENKKALIKMANDLKTLSNYKTELQTLVNKLVREIDKGCKCISGGYQWARHHQAGHYYPTSTHGEIRFNLMNIWLQSIHGNKHKHGDTLNYRNNLAKLDEKLLAYIEDLPTIYKGMKFGIPELKEAISSAKTCVKELTRLNQLEPTPRSFARRVELRVIYNIKLGLYL